MTDVLHHARTTPTQQASLSHRMRFLSNLNARAALVKPKPVVPIPRAPSLNDMAFGPILPVIRRPPPKVYDIVKATALHYGLTKVEMMSRRRFLRLAHPRQTAMYLCYTLTLHSYPEIGRRFGDMDHTTVMHGVERVQQRINGGDAATTHAVDTIRMTLSASFDVNPEAWA